MKIEIRPIEVKRWHGKKGKESFRRPVKIQALVRADRMEHATGLSKEEEEKYGELLRQDLSPNYNPDVPHPFWTSSMATVKLENSTMFFDPSNPLDYVKIAIMKASKLVANSRAEYEQGLFPEAEFVIFDEHEEIAVKAAKADIRRKAFVEASKMSKSAKQEIVLLLAGKNTKGKPDGFVDLEMDNLIDRDPREALRYIKRDKKTNAVEALVTEALQKSRLKRKGHKIYYYESVLGQDVPDVAEYLSQDINQELKLRLMEEINK